MRLRSVCMSFLVFFFLAVEVSRADEPETLVQLGDFKRQIGDTPDTFGVEVYEVNWDQREHPNGLIDTSLLPHLCTQNTSLNNRCVHELRINMKSTAPYKEVFLVYERAGVEMDEIIFDNNKKGGVAAHGVLSGGAAAEEGFWLTVSFGLGMITPRKTHTLIIRSPDNVSGNGIFYIGGIKIVGYRPGKAGSN